MMTVLESKDSSRKRGHFYLVRLILVLDSLKSNKIYFEKVDIYKMGGQLQENEDTFGEHDSLESFGPF